jgi:hypothetical protein
MNKRVVICQNGAYGLEWAMLKYDGQIKQVNRTYRTILLTNGDEITIVSEIRQVTGMVIDSYEICPDYESLEMAVKARIR